MRVLSNTTSPLAILRRETFRVVAASRVNPT